jgi:organic hydroperoxide reductase OsmC/OhrA
MAKHVAKTVWKLGAGEDFLAGRYSRVHELRFDGGAVIAASASPHVVPAPWSDTKAIDPEELFVASLSNCHMLWFLDFAKRARIDVRAYSDEAEGVMEKDADGKVSITRVTLRPLVECDADAAVLEHIHHKAHDACFIANSVKTEVSIDMRFTS